MKATCISNGYMPGIYIIWEIPHDNVTGYEIYRDGQMIASSLLESEDERVEFVPPTVFDNDHHTNLFKKDSHFKLMYVDENVKTYQHYEYKVVAKRLDESGNTVEEIESEIVRVQAQ